MRHKSRSEAEPPAAASATGSDLALSARGLHKTYDTPTGPLPVLRGADLDVKRGTILAVTGASGAGKSTLLNVLGTLDRPDSGTLDVRGRRLERLESRELAAFRARHLGFVFQFHHLLPEFTAEENVMMPLLIAGRGAAEARDTARRTLAAVGLPARWQHRPSELSGGEAQRVAVARALAGSPELVLADEPSGNLDPASAAALHDLLATLAHDQHRTFVVATHSDSLAARADRVLTLEAGVLRPGR